MSFTHFCTFRSVYRWEVDIYKDVIGGIGPDVGSIQARMAFEI